VSLIIKINRVNLASVRNFFRTPIEPPANRDLVGNYTSGFEPFSQEGLLSSYDADRAEQEFARLYAAGEAERAAAVARGTVLEDSSSSDAIIHGGKEGNRGNPAAFVVFTAIDLIMQSIEGIYDNIEGKGFTLDNFDPTNRYAIQTNNRFFNKDSKVGDEIQFTLNDITKKPITPTNVVWGIDNPKDVGGYLTMDASNGKLKLLAIPPNAIKVSVNVTFHYIFNGNERSSQVQ
jgi:hypothetical protein